MKYEIEKPPYFDTEMGAILEAMILFHGETNAEIASRAGIKPEKVFALIGELRSRNAIYRYKKKWYPKPDISQKWREFYDNYTVVGTYDRHLILIEEDKKGEDRLRDWVNRFIEHDDMGQMQKKIDDENKQYFISGTALTAFCNMLILQANREIITVNPFLEVLPITKSLVKKRRNGVNVLVETRPPRDVKGRGKKKHEDCIQFLVKSDVFVEFAGSIHAKILIVDNCVAVVSSLNYISSSTSGNSWEAGIVSMDKKIIGDIRQTIFSIEDTIVIPVKE